MSDFDWSRRGQSAAMLEEARSYRFRPEWRPLLLQYMGLAPGMQVLEVGCGPGTLAPYLAEGIAPGTVTGLDLDARFIERARSKAEQAGFRGVQYVVGDAYALPFPDATFDAVTSYTGIGVLTDPERAIAEMVRVCRPGGSISIMEAISGPNGVSGGLEQAAGALAELYPETAEYRALLDRFRLIEKEYLLPRAIERDQIGNRTWPVAAFPGLLARLGLEGVRINAWAYCQAPDDARTPEDERRARRMAEHSQQMRNFASYRHDEALAAMNAQGFTRNDFDRLMTLAEVRFQWLMEHALYDWTAGLSLVMAGRKPA